MQRQFAYVIVCGTLAWISACQDGGLDPRLPSPVCAEVISLSIGESRSLSASQAACIQFARQQGSEFVLSYLDPYSVDAARQKPYEYVPLFTDSVRVRASPQSAGWLASSARRRVDASRAAGIASERLQSDVVRPARARTAATLSSRYSIGDTLTHGFDGYTGVQTAQVVAVYHDYLVFAVVRSDTGRFRAYEPKVKRAADLYVAEAEPFLNASFGGPRPTSNGAGQFLILVEMGEGVAGRAWPDKVQLMMGMSRYALAVDHYLVLAHEMTHVKQFQYSASRPSDVPAVWTQWAVEGGARLVEGELARRHIGMDFLANWDWQSPTVDPFVEAYRQVVADFSLGEVAYGYGSSAAVLRDFVQRLVVSGNATLDVAFGLVLRSALHGWFGCTSSSTCTTAGLASQMTTVLGVPFDPTSALLRMVASAAADDLTENAEFQNLSFYELTVPENELGTPVVMPLVKNVGPASAAAENFHRRGALGAFRILDTGAGAAYHAEGSVPLQWQLLRIR